MALSLPIKKGPVAASEFASLLRGVIEQACASQYQPVSIPTKIGLAVSGGIDSMALAHLVHKLSSFKNEFENTTFRAMVVDHGLRPGSREEAESVCGSLEGMGLPASLLSIPDDSFIPSPSPSPTTARLNRGVSFLPTLSPLPPPPPPARPSSSKLESIARRHRYRLFAKTCQEHNITHLITAHHANDQAETVLMRLLAGSGTAGLAGIAPARIGLPECEDLFGADEVVVLRPFLGVFKERLRETLTSQNIPWHEDPTNADTSLTTRNAIRAFLSPPPTTTSEPPSPTSKQKSKPPQPTLPKALTPSSLLLLSTTITSSNLKTQELVDWYLSRCILRHIHVSNVIEAFIPLELLCMPLKLLTRVLARLAAVVSPLDRIDLVQMSRVAKNIMEKTDPAGEAYSYVGNSDPDGVGWDGREVIPKSKTKRKDFREFFEKPMYSGTAITENNVFWEAVYCRPIARRPEGVLVSCFRQPYIRQSKKRETDTPEVDIHHDDTEKWYLFDGRFWLKYAGDYERPKSKSENKKKVEEEEIPRQTIFTRLSNEKARRIFITGARKEVMYRADNDGIRYDDTTDVDGKKMMSMLRMRFKSEAPGKSRTVVPVLCEEGWQSAVKTWKVPYSVLGFPTFGIGGEMMGRWEWKVKKKLVVKGVEIGNVPVTLVSGKAVPL
ncbi:hypothetical protein TWF730_000823 [Orbilia blumenaviensis]|uniref:tRNA(Ile)-lysidine synthetase n=1 Tax=Orbilia blumenaviensis TaxID=1796055 RepID=A0AAV9VMS3_9PEZI